MAPIRKPGRFVTKRMGASRPPVDQLSDESLLNGLGVGDPACSAAFVRRFQRRVYGLALSILGEPGLAQDTAQEALTRAWRHAQAFDARKGSVAGWLLSITRNLAIDALRLRRAVPADPDAILQLNAKVAGHGPATPEEAAASAEDTTRVRVAISSLPLEQQRALVMSAIYGRTAQEISDAEGIPLGTAKTRVRAAMLKLRAALVEEGAAWA